jgi:hypothetical protein
MKDTKKKERKRRRNTDGRTRWKGRMKERKNYGKDEITEKRQENRENRRKEHKENKMRKMTENEQQ